MNLEELTKYFDEIRKLFPIRINYIAMREDFFNSWNAETIEKKETDSLYIRLNEMVTFGIPVHKTKYLGHPFMVSVTLTATNQDHILAPEQIGPFFQKYGKDQTNA